MTVSVSKSVLQNALISAHIPHGQQTVIRNGVSFEYIQVEAAAMPKTRAMFGWHDTDFVIGTVGRLVPVKNQSMLIQLVDYLRASYPHIRLLIIGDGPLKHVLQKQVTDRGLCESIRLVSDNAVSYYSLFDCFVQTSFAEGLSMALLEAMFFKMPVIVSHDSCMHDIIIHDKNGYLFDVHDLVALTELLERIMHDKFLRIRLGNCAYQAVINTYTCDHMIESYRYLFEQIGLQSIGKS